MSSELDKALEAIEKELWADYTETVIDHAHNPRNLGTIDNADGCATVLGSCGDTMQIWLNVTDGRIKYIRFLTDGCGATLAAGSILTELVKGKSTTEAFRISQQDLLDALGGLPEGNIHCALLATQTLKEAIKDYLAFKNEPWKRAYRRS